MPGIVLRDGMPLRITERCFRHRPRMPMFRPRPEAAIFPKFITDAQPLEAELTPPFGSRGGVSAQCNLTLSGTDSPDSMTALLTCSDPQIMFTFPNGERITSGSAVSLLSGTHGISFTPRAAGSPDGYAACNGRLRTKRRAVVYAGGALSEIYVIAADTSLGISIFEFPDDADGLVQGV